MPSSAFLSLNILLSLALYVFSKRARLALLYTTGIALCLSWPKLPRGGFLKIIPIGIPTYTGMKTGLHADVSPKNRFSCRRRSECRPKQAWKTRLRSWSVPFQGSAREELSGHDSSAQKRRMLRAASYLTIADSHCVAPCSSLAAEINQMILFASDFPAKSL